MPSELTADVGMNSSPGQGVCLSLCSRGFDIFHLFCPPLFGAKSKHSRAKATVVSLLLR